MQHAGQLGQETKFVLCVFRRVVTHAKAQRASLVTQRVSLPAVRESRVRALAWEDPLEKEMAIHSRILAWTIPCTVEPGGLQSMGHKSQTRLSDSHFHPLSLPTLALPCLIHSTGLVLLSPPPPPLNSLELRGHPQTLQGGSILLVCRWRGSGPWGWGGDQVTLAEPEQEGATVRTLRPESMPLFP